MNAASDGLGFAGDILVICIILSIGIAVGRMSNQMSRATSSVINQNTVEYLEADVSTLLASKHTGASVKQYVNKYRRSMTVKIVTKKSANASADPLEITATTSIAPLKDESSLYFIDNNAQFTCAASKDGNGNYKAIRFTQVGSSTTPVLGHISNGTDAKNYLDSFFGGSGMTWDQIVTNVKTKITDSDASKQKLVSEINKYYSSDVVSTSSSWNDIIEVVAKMFSDYKGALDATVTTTQHHRSKISVAAGASKDFDFTPTTIIVTDDTTNKVYVWTSEGTAGWITQPADFSIIGSTVTNGSTTTSMSVVAYN